MFQQSFHCLKNLCKWLFGIANSCLIVYLLSPPCFETFSPPTVPLVNSLTICCILKVNDAFLIEENCQHHFYLALKLVCLSRSWIPWSLPLWWLGFCFWVVPLDPRFITGNYCLHEVCVLISTLQQIPGYCKASLFLLGCHRFWNEFHWDAWCAQMLCQNGLYQTKWKPQLFGEVLNCYSVVIQHCRTHFVSHHLVPVVEGIHELPSLSTNIHPSLNHLNHSLTCVRPIVSFPNAFWIIL